MCIADSWCWPAAWAVGLLAIAPGEAPGQPAAPDTRALRRTPVVEVFQQCKETVVFVTGPIIRPGQSPADEFFVPSTPGPQEQNVGSGCVLHPAGYVLTNAHAVEKLIEPVVVLSDGRRYPAEVVAVVHQQDLALLKVDPPAPLAAVRLGRPGDLMVGETVVVIANPHGLLYTCTSGVLSAMGRATNLADMPGVVLRGLIQSDAAINPGSSGGPWFNIAGEMIGMTSSMKRDAENIAFAIPTATVCRHLPEMLDIERRQGMLTGLEVRGEGPATVAAVQPDSPAAQAGFQPGDTLVSVAGRAVPGAAEYHLALVGHKPQEPLAVELFRQGKPQKLTLVPAARPKPDPAALLRRLGLSAAPLEPAKAKAMQLRVARGVLVTAVDAKRYEMLAHRPEPGDVLARIGPIRPRDLEHVGLLLEKARPGQTLALVFCRRRGDQAMRIDMNVVVPP